MRSSRVADPLPPAVKKSIEAVWRIESARIVASLAKMVGGIDLAEDLAQEALAEALRRGFPSRRRIRVSGPSG